MVRVRFFRGITAAVCLAAMVSFAGAADPKSKPANKDIEALRQTIEEQSKQIEALTQQIAHLTELLEAHGISTASATATPSPSPAASPTPENTGPAMAGVVETPGTHTVTKGETLTSIAKHYKITVGELEKVNKISNDRTLQIGQVLTIPAATPSPTPEEKKENQ